MVKKMKAFSLKEILGEPVSYIIPHYQRTYAWGKEEISQIIRDIEDFFKPKSRGDNRNYYLGSLVCKKREKGFDLIDGQQRYITITLINLVLKNWSDSDIKDIINTTNINFGTRTEIGNYIKKLYEITKNSDEFSSQIDELIEKNESNITGVKNFRTAIITIQGELRKIKTNITDFAYNFYNKVFLFRTETPSGEDGMEGNDLNHYFEIMNNRGEQLEQHEIVKASLMEKISNKNKFAAIWDACYDMDNYIFDKKIEIEGLFDENGDLNEGIENFSKIPDVREYGNTKAQLAAIIEDFKVNNSSNNEADENDGLLNEKDEKVAGKYKSIINFSNFLLQVLSLEYQNISLNDKLLVKQFRENCSNSEKAEKFIFNLLKYRVFFDKYIIKQPNLTNFEAENALENSVDNWEIKKIKDMKDDIDGDGDKLTKLQTMLHYSDSQKTYNYWLQHILETKMKGEINIDNIKDYQNELFKFAKDKFKFDKKLNDENSLSYPNVEIYTFYFIDFLLWKLYKEEVEVENIFQSDKNTKKIQNLRNKISKHGKLFYNFRFRDLDSKEHLAARKSNADSIHPICHKKLNGIGNLCLISTHENSVGSKQSPIYKKNQFQMKNSSLKRIIMFESFENDKWETEQIQNHEEEIMDLLKYYLS